MSIERHECNWQAWRRAKDGGTPLAEWLAAAGDARQGLAALATSLGWPCWDSEALANGQPVLDRWPLASAQTARAVLLRSATGRMHAVLSDPLDEDLMVRMAHRADEPLHWTLASAADIHACLNRLEAATRAMDGLQWSGVPADSQAPRGEELSLASVADASHPTVRLVNSTLYDALRAGASDVHLESTPSGLAIKLRIDGMLDTLTEVPGTEQAEQAISRLKVLAELDIAERRVPQDGSFRVHLQGRDVDLRLSIIPGVHGEDAVIRILDKRALIESHGRLDLDALGFDAHSVAHLREAMRAAHGMVLVTGPTGSGKTTTLYAALAETHTGREKVITIEDPVEYQLPGVLQIPVNEKKGLSFARGLRSILRHDPDTIMVGEIRDRETAEIAVQSALTGHLVLTTVHANNVFDVFSRFTHMGLDPHALVSALNGVWAQRLLRLNCPACRRPVAPEAGEWRRLGLTDAHAAGHCWQQGLGCGECRGTGYRGRRAVAEVLLLDDELREHIVARAPLRQIKQLARDKGTRRLLDAALTLAMAGETTLEEVQRVTLAH